MKDIPILIQEPELISLINQVKNGAVPLCELRRKIGRRKADKGLIQAVLTVQNLKIAFQQYLDNPIRAEFDFVKECLGLHKGKEIKHFTLDENVHVKEISKTSMLVIIKGDN